MSKEERIKQEIGVLKLFSGGFLAIDASLIAWLAQDYAQAERILIVVSLIAIATATTILAFLLLRLYDRLKRLEEF